MKKHAVCLLLILLSSAVLAQTPSSTVRICDDRGCEERPRDAVTFNPNAPGDSAAEQQAAKLIALAEKDPRAAYDLGLRYFRGDGVRQDSYQALKWMRDAAERGYLKAQTAVGRLYLMGLEEMGSDPSEAEKWLSIAAGRGDKEAKTLLAQATKAKQNEVAYRRWVDSQKAIWNSYWMDRYQYEWQWRNGGWYEYRPYYGPRY
ncbi:tetratricopeptide repeat protein [uncultured Zoogloea sp.]|uniref:tetratricopeptide repeat protein n=1 Tax=uncultured Zoogloea sp. TaxID=160237 RepID=UPI00261183E3|nr:tetratricopeptide repeat protein [uncultured Zoogloea sp.]